MRFRDFIYREDALSNIISMFGTGTPGAGGTSASVTGGATNAFGSGMTGGANAPQTGGTVQNVQNQIKPEDRKKLDTVPSPSDAQQANDMLDLFNKALESQGLRVGTMPANLTQDKLRQAADQAIKMGTPISADAIKTFADKVNPADFQAVLANMQRNQPSPTDQAKAQAAQTGQAMAGQQSMVGIGV